LRFDLIAWSAFFVCVLFRLYHLGHFSLWLDEIGQVVAAQYPLGQLLAVVGTHLSPPLDYLLMKPFLGLGSADFIARFPAFLYGVAAIPLMFLLGRKIAGDEAAGFGSLLLAFSPMAIAYSQEARMYSLFLLLSLASYLCFMRLMEKPSLGSTATLSLINGGLVLTHYFGFVVLGMEAILGCLWAIRKGWKREYAWLLVSFGLPLLIFAPWVPVLAKQITSSGGQIGYALPAGKDFFKYLFNAFSVHTGGEEGAWYYFYILVFAAGLGIAIKEKKTSIVVLATGVVTVLLSAYVVNGVKPIVTTRNLIFLLPLYLLVGAYALARLREAARIPSWVLAAAIGLFLLPPGLSLPCCWAPGFQAGLETG